MYEKNILLNQSIDQNYFYEAKLPHSKSKPPSALTSTSGEHRFRSHITPNGKSIIFADTDLSLKENERGATPDSFAFLDNRSQTNSLGRTSFNFPKDANTGKELEDLKGILAKCDDPKEIIREFENYQPRNKEIAIANLKKSQHVKIKKYKESLYFGEFFNGKRHGKGIMIYNPKRLYEGDWENDSKHGKGFEILSNGSCYEGTYLNGKPEGFGTFTWPNGEVYEGEWKNGVKHGSGMWKGIKGESYYGEWRNGKAEGLGVHIWRNGDKYEGEFKGFLKHGNGIEKFVNGDTYTGSYANGKPDGYGEYHWANGCQYKGNFKNGLRHGQGVWKKGGNDDEIYDGDWVNDKKCGFGLYKWASGNYYQGNYFDDLRHGYGEMHWVDGSAYFGQWEMGIQHGEGQLRIPGKGVKRGMFKKNLLIDNETYSTEIDEQNKGINNSILKGYGNEAGMTKTRMRNRSVNTRPRKLSNKNNLSFHSDRSDPNDSILPGVNNKLNYSIQMKPTTQRTSISSVQTRKAAFNQSMNVKDVMTGPWTKYKGVVKNLPQNRNI